MVKKILMIVAITAILAGCGNVDKVAGKKILESQGYTDVQLGGYSFWITGCSDKEDFNTSFTAVGSNGTKVEGVLCQGWFKGITIRYF